MDRFSQILYDLGKEIDLDLYPDENGVCQIKHNEQIEFQILYDEPKERIMLASFVCEVPAGKYREKLLSTALAHNNQYPRVGFFAYSERNNQLTLISYQSAIELTGEKLKEIVDTFLELALQWKEAVETGNPLPTSQSEGESGQMFGLKP